MPTYELVGYKVMHGGRLWPCIRISDGHYTCGYCQERDVNSYPNEGDQCECGARLLPEWKRIDPSALHGKGSASK